MTQYAHLISRVVLNLAAVLGIAVVMVTSTNVTSYADEGTPPPPQNIPVIVITEPISSSQVRPRHRLSRQTGERVDLVLRSASRFIERRY